MSEILFLNRFDETFKDKILLTPIDHPSIKYGWKQIRLKIKNKSFTFESIGEIIRDKVKEPIVLNKIEIGFVDENNNIVTPIVFHDVLTASREEYKFIFSELDKTYSIKHSTVSKKEKSSEAKYTSAPELKIEDILIRLDKDDTLFDFIIKYITSNKFDIKKGTEFNITESKLKEVINYIKKNEKTILTKHKHLRPIINILRG